MMDPTQEHKDPSTENPQEAPPPEQPVNSKLNAERFIAQVSNQIQDLNDTTSPVFELKDYLITQNIIEKYAELNEIKEEATVTDNSQERGEGEKNSELGDHSQLSSDVEESYEGNMELGQEGGQENAEVNENSLKRKGRGVMHNHFKDRLTSFRLPKDIHDYTIDTVAYYFFDASKEDTVQCSACTRAYKPSTRVDTLIRHLSKKHGVQSNLFFRGPKQAFLAGGSIRPKIARAQSQNDLPASIQPAFIPPHISSFRSQSGLEEALITWILSDSLPLNIVESPQFTHLMRMIAPSAQLPTVSRLREILKNMLNSQPPVDNQPHPSLTDFEASAFLASFPVDSLSMLTNSEVQAEPIFETINSETFLRRPGRPPKKKSSKLTHSTDSLPTAATVSAYAQNFSESFMFRKSPPNH